jgi:CBS domain-containing protein
MSRALRLMRDAGVRHLPVVDGDILLGMVSARDARPAQLADFASPPPYREVALENLL